MAQEGYDKLVSCIAHGVARYHDFMMNSFKKSDDESDRKWNRAITQAMCATFFAGMNTTLMLQADGIADDDEDVKAAVDSVVYGNLFTARSMMDNGESKDSLAVYIDEFKDRAEVLSSISVLLMSFDLDTLKKLSGRFEKMCADKAVPSDDMLESLAKFKDKEE